MAAMMISRTQKKHHMGIRGFEAILEEIPLPLHCIKALCREIRGIIFPLFNYGGLDTGTRPNPEQLYRPIVKAFDASTEGSSG